MPKRQVRAQWKVVALALAGLNVVTLVGGGLAWADHYRPLAVGPGFSAAAGERFTDGVDQLGRIGGSTLSGRVLDPYAPRHPFSDRVSFLYRHRQTVTYTFSIVNRGSVGVTVTGFSLGQENPHLLLRPTSVHITRQGGLTPNVNDTEPMRPFVLKPGRARSIVVHARFGCEQFRGGAQDYMGFDVRYDVLTRPNRASLEFPTHFRVENPNDCPGRPAEPHWPAPAPMAPPSLATP